jgi:hypothetical protein
VEAFNRRLVTAAGSGADLSKVLAMLDPDPSRYSSVTDGPQIVELVLSEAGAELTSAPQLPGFRSLVSTAMPTTAPAARPAVATSSDGRMLLAWIEWQDRLGEQVMAVMIDSSGGHLSAPVPVSGPSADCLRPSVAFDGDGVGWVCFGLRRGGQVGVWCVKQRPDGGWGEAELLSTTAHPSFNQELLCHEDGSLECCWQGYDNGRFRIFSRRQQGGGFGETELLSAGHERNVWDPTLAVDAVGRTCYAWTTYGEAGYQTAVLMRESGRAPVRQMLSTSGSYSLHPSLAFARDGSLWCAFDAVALGGHGGSGPTRLRTRAEMQLPRRTGHRADGKAVPGDLAPEVSAEVTVARLGEVGAAPEQVGDVGVGVQISPAALPRLVRTADGSMAVAYRCLRRLPLMLYFWDTVIEWHGPAGWGHLTTFDHPDGPLEEPAVAANGADAVVSWQQDGRKDRQLEWTEGFGGEECLARREHYGEVVWHSVHSGGGVRLGRVPPPAAPAGDQVGPVTGRPLVIGQPAGDSRPWARARLSGRKERYRTSYGDGSYTLYWGDLHRHSLVSRCTAGDEPELDDFYRYSFDVCEYDFWAVTDHAENTSQYQWWAIQKLADVLHVEDRFVPFYGFEWTAATGHQNVIYDSARRGAPIYSSTAAETSTPDRLWAHLRSAGQRSLTIPHHPGSAMVAFDWSYHADDMQRLVEVFQACRGNYEDDGCFRQYSDGTLAGTFVTDGLRHGHRFGLISSSDHGNGASYVGAFAEELSRPSVFSALYDRRTIAATTRDIVVDFRLNDCFMGAEAAPATTARLAVTAQGYCGIARVDVVRDAMVAHSLQPEPAVEKGEVAVAMRVEWSSGEDPRADWSGYLEVEQGRVLETKFWSPEIVDAGPHRVAWSAQTRDFCSQYGAQRGGVELTLIGSPQATVRIVTSALGGSTTLGELRSSGAVTIGRGTAGSLSLRQATGGLCSLGTNEVVAAFEEAVTAPSWYYARVILEDGEMAWSSPIWVTPA